MKEESRIVEETRQKIASGELTYDQMKEKLIAAIDKEYEKEGEPDVNLINACEELLAALATDGQAIPETYQEKYGEVIKQNIQVSHRSKNRGGFVKRLAISLVVLILLLGGGQAFLHREWFEHGTTDDEQQHTIQGFVVDPGLVAKAIADNSSETRILLSNTYYEVKDFLGFDLPKAIFLNGWNIELFRIEIKPLYIKCAVRYINRSYSNISLTLQLKLFTNTENAYASFEQDSLGERIMINGTEVYHCSNESNNTFMWLNNNCYYHCHGEITDKTLISVVEQLIGGEEND